MYVCMYVCIQAQKPFSLNNKYYREVQYMHSYSDLRDELMHFEYVRCKTLSNLFEWFERNFRRFHSRPIEVHSCIHSAVELCDHRGVSIYILFHSPTSRRSLEASRFLPISQSAWLRWSAATAYYDTQQSLNIKQNFIKLYDYIMNIVSLNSTGGWRANYFQLERPVKTISNQILYLRLIKIRWIM